MVGRKVHILKEFGERSFPVSWKMITAFGNRDQFRSYIAVGTKASLNR